MINRIDIKEIESIICKNEGKIIILDSQNIHFEEKILSHEAFGKTNGANIYLANNCAKVDSSTIIQMYYLYEFSNKIKLITESKQFPSLFNYVKTGILTIDEMIDAILYET